MQFACIHDKSFIKGEMYGCSTWLLQMEGYHPQTQGKIERWHRSMKNQILLDNYYLPGQLKAALQQFVDYYNHERYHESLKNLTSADVFYGCGQEIPDQREKIKLATLAMRRKMHYDNQLGHTIR